MHDLDPNYFLPLWRAVVSYFRRYPPLVQAQQQLPQRTQPEPIREPSIHEGDAHELRDRA